MIKNRGTIQVQQLQLLHIFQIEPPQDKKHYYFEKWTIQMQTVQQRL